MKNYLTRTLGLLIVLCMSLLAMACGGKSNKPQVEMGFGYFDNKREYILVSETLKGSCELPILNLVAYKDKIFDLETKEQFDGVVSEKAITFSYELDEDLFLVEGKFSTNKKKIKGDWQSLEDADCFGVFYGVPYVEPVENEEEVSTDEEAASENQ